MAEPLRQCTKAYSYYMAPVKCGIEQVRALVEAGAPIGDAIRIALGGSVPRWAAKHGLARTPASMTINGRRVPPDRRTVAALAADLGAPEDDVRSLLLEATKVLAGAAA